MHEDLVAKFNRNIQSDLICMYSAIDGQAHFTKEDCYAINRLVTKRKNESIAKKLTIMVSSQGGDLINIMKLMTSLRSKYEHITVYVPKIGKSSITFLTMTAQAAYVRKCAHLSDFSPAPSTYFNQKTSSILIGHIIAPIEKGILHECDHKSRVAILSTIIVKYFVHPPDKHGETILGENFFKDFENYENVHVYNEDNYVFRELNSLNFILEKKFIDEPSTQKIISFNNHFYVS